MSTPLDPQDELTERLRDLGRRPVDPTLQSEHLTAIAGVRGGRSVGASIASRVKLATAVLGGFLLGATGLASAGAMGPLQPAAETTIEAVTPFELPAASEKGQATAEANKNKKSKGKGPKGAKGQAGEGPGSAKNWDGCATTFGGEPASRRNRGQYLKDAREHGTPAEFEAARKSDCGKGIGAEGDEDTAETGNGNEGGTPPANGAGGRPEAGDTPKGGPDQPHGKSDSAPAGEAPREPKAAEGDGADGEATGAGKKDPGATSAGRSGVKAPPAVTPVQPTPETGEGTGVDRRSERRGAAKPGATRPAPAPATQPGA